MFGVDARSLPPGSSWCRRQLAVRSVSLMSEALIRQALRTHVLATAADDEAAATVDEFWIPRSHERADVVLINGVLAAYEIKTEKDTLRRLPRQVEAYNRVFDRCTAVLAEKHVDAAMDVVPEWWGVMCASVDGGVTFRVVREGCANGEVKPDILVRLLWRQEVARALTDLGFPVQPRASRSALWAALLELVDVADLQDVVRRELRLRKDRRGANTSRFTPPPRAGVVGR